MPVTDLRRQTSAVIRGVQEDGDIVYITQHGRPAAVLLDHERFEALLAREQQQERWPANYFEDTYGGLADDPLTRSAPGPHETREALA
jgi:prevent-host-death family protein